MVDSEHVTVERPELDRTEITEEVESVQISIIADDRTRTFDREDIIRADAAYDGAGFVAIEVIFDSDPDLMRGLSGATIQYREGESEWGHVPWAKTGDQQVMLVIEGGDRHV